MQSPIIVFDHINGVVANIQPGPGDTKLAELNRVQNQQVVTAGRPAK